MTPAERVAQREWRQRGMVLTHTPYLSSRGVLGPLAPNYGYSGAVPLGPYSQAWQGVQKVNAVANVGMKWATYEYLNLTAQARRTEFIQMNNRTATLIGPGIMTAPREAQAANFRSGVPSSTQHHNAVLRRLLARSGG